MDDKILREFIVKWWNKIADKENYNRVHNKINDKCIEGMQLILDDLMSVSNLMINEDYNKGEFTVSRKHDFNI